MAEITRTTSSETDAKENAAYSCVFTKQGWSMDDWKFVRRGDMQSLDEWEQRDEYIENKDSSSHSFTSMIHRKKWDGNFTVTAGMAFLERMAPSIVLAWKFGTDAQNRPIYQENIEIVLWDEGINCWLHGQENGKPTWVKSAYCRFHVPKSIRHQLQVSRKGQELSISVGERSFGYRVDTMPDQLYLGITAAEGINRLYDFDVRAL